MIEGNRMCAASSTSVLDHKKGGAGPLSISSFSFGCLLLPLAVFSFAREILDLRLGLL